MKGPQLRLDIGRECAYQQRKPAFRIGDGRDKQRHLSLEAAKLALCERHIEFIGETPVEPRLSQLRRLFCGLHGTARDLQAKLQAAQVHVIARHIADDGDKRGIAHLGERLGVVPHRFEQAAVLAPDVELPCRVEARHPVHVV